MTQSRAFGVPGTFASTVKATGLFPFTSSYAVWAGTCDANNPGSGLALGSYTVPVGQTAPTAANVTLQLPSLNITVWKGTSSGSNGGASSGATVKLVDEDCPEAGTQTYTTNSSGKLATFPGMPWGRYDICVSGPSSSGTRRLNFDNVDIKNPSSPVGGHRLPAQRHHDQPLLLMERLARIRDDQAGFSLIELLVSMLIGMVVLFGILAIVDGTTRSSARTTARVTANQTARPALTKIIDELHSSCISPDLAPVQAGSSDTALTFIYSTDRGVAPVPEQRKIELTTVGGVGTIDETRYAYAAGIAPTWTFAPTGTTTRMVTGVTAATTSGTTTVPLFRYYAYNPSTATVSTTPLTTPLSAEDAATVVKVTVAFAVKPNKNTTTNDPAATVSLSDSVLLRFSPASTVAGESLLPCA